MNQLTDELEYKDLVLELEGMALRPHSVSWEKHHGHGGTEEYPTGCAAYGYAKRLVAGRFLTSYEITDESKCDCGALQHNQRAKKITDLLLSGNKQTSI